MLSVPSSLHAGGVAGGWLGIGTLSFRSPLHAGGVAGGWLGLGVPSSLHANCFDVGEAMRSARDEREYGGVTLASVVGVEASASHPVLALKGGGVMVVVVAAVVVVASDVALGGGLVNAAARGEVPGSEVGGGLHLLPLSLPPSTPPSPPSGA